MAESILTDTPQPSTREHRALKLYRERRHEIVLVDTDTFEVPSCTGRGVYLVEYGGENESCNCPDARRHPELNCKHVLAVALCFAKRRQLRYGRGRAAPGRDLSEHKLSPASVSRTPGLRPTAIHEGNTVDTTKSSAPRATHRDDAQRIREDAAAHPDRTYREHVEAACEGCSKRFRHRDLVEVMPEHLDFSLSVFEGERYCRSCAHNAGIL